MHRWILTPDLFYFTSLATLGSRKVSKAAKLFKEFNFPGFSHCFSVRIEQSSKMNETKLNDAILGWFFEVFLIITGKQWLKTRKLNSLINFASFYGKLYQYLLYILSLVKPAMKITCDLKKNSGFWKFLFVLFSIVL